MHIRKAAASAALAISVGLSATAAVAQDQYPSRPIEVIVTFGSGGGADLMGRQFALLAEKRLGVAMPVANVAGASGNAGLTRLLSNAADGYSVATLIALSVSSWAAGLGSARPENFQYVAMMQNSPSMLFVPRDSPFKTWDELEAHARENPGAIRVATSGFGTQDDITIRYLANEGVQMTNVPFAAPSERYAAAVGSHTDAIYEEPGDVAQFLESGDLRPIIVFDDDRHEAFPDVETSAEHDFDISDLPNFRTIAVHVDTPPEVVTKLAEVASEILETEEWKTFCNRTYTCTAPLTPEETGARVQEFYDNVGGYLKKFGG